MTNPDERSDTDLLVAWQAGDADAGSAFVERHFMPVYRFFSTKLPAEADDLTQQTFTDLQRTVAQIRDPTRGRAYVMRIARNRLYMSLRSRAVHDRIFDPAQMSIAAVGAEPHVSTALAKRREVRLLLQALRMIPLDAQVVLELYYWEELPVRDIAEIVGVKPGTIMSRLHRSRDKLQRALGEISDDAALVASATAGLETWANDVRGEVQRPADGA